MTLNSTASATLDGLQDVQTAVRDAITGYETMHGKAEPSFKPLVAHILELHRRHDTELVAMLAATGEPSQMSGSWMSSVHQGVVTVRSWFDEIDHGLLPEVIDGERRLVEAYSDALIAEHPSWATKALERQRDAVAALVRELEQQTPTTST